MEGKVVAILAGLMAGVMVGLMVVGIGYIVYEYTVKPYLMIRSMPTEMKKIMGVEKNSFWDGQVVGEVGGREWKNKEGRWKRTK